LPKATYISERVLQGLTSVPRIPSDLISEIMSSSYSTTVVVLRHLTSHISHTAVFDFFLVRDHNRPPLQHASWCACSEGVCWKFVVWSLWKRNDFLL